MNRSDGQRRYGDVPVIVIGAAAGGVDPLEHFIGAVPPGAGWCCIVLRHQSEDLSGDDGDARAEALARRTTWPVRPLEDGERPIPGTILINRPGTQVEWRDGRFRVTALSEDQPAGFPLIDTAMASLCARRAGAVAGVILSGAGQDGARGARALRAAGHPILAQDPAEALFPAMPAAAIEAGAVVATRPAGDLPGALAALLSDRRSPAPTQPSEAKDAILDLVGSRMRVDLAAYRQAPLRDRLDQARRHRGFDTPEAFAAALQRDAGMIQALFAELMTTRKGRFHGDARAFRALRRQVIDPLVAQSRPEEALRIWVPGCGTGEEAYSIAMELTEALRAAGVRRRYRVIATDVQPGAIEKASAGVFPTEAVKSVPARMRRAYFHRHDAGVLIDPQLREHVIFSVHDVLSDPPFLNLDLISCRNLLSAFRDEAQARVLSMFLFGLRPGGRLMLDPEEAPGAQSSAFVPIGAEPGLFQVRPPDERSAAAASAGTEEGPADPAPITAERWTEGADRDARLLRSYEALMRRYAPSSIMLRPDDGEVVAWFGDAGAYVDSLGRSGSHPLGQVVQPDLAREIRAGMEKLRVAPVPPLEQRVSLRLAEGETHELILRMEWLGAGLSDPGLILVRLSGREEVTGPGTEGEPPSGGSDQRSPGAVAALPERALSTSDRTLDFVLARLQVSGADLSPIPFAPSPVAEAARGARSATDRAEVPPRADSGLSVVPMESAGKVALLAGLSPDMEEVLDFMQVAAVAVDAERRILRTSRLFRAAIGAAEDMAGCPLSGVDLQVGELSLDEVAAEVLRQGRGLRGWGPLSGAEGEARSSLYELRGQPVPGAQSAPGAAAVVLTLAAAPVTGDASPASVPQTGGADQ
ncbi:hypothetical protein KUV28_03650 [Ferrimonas balearica]|nr:hypothetical protein [Ferrimonas balearica]